MYELMSIYDEKEFKGKSPIGWIIAGVAVLLVVILLSVCLRTVAPTEVAVKYNPLTHSRRVLTSGVHFVAPWASLKKWPITVQTVNYKDQSQSKDGIFLIYDMYMTYRFDASNVMALYEKFADKNQRTIESVFLPSIWTQALNKIASTYGHEQILGNETTANSLPEIQAKLYTSLKEQLYGYNMIVEVISIKDADAGPQIEAAIGARGEAKQRAEAAKYLKQKAEEEAKAEVIAAQGKADAMVVAAKGQAEANKLLATTTDRALEIKKLEVQREQIAKWNGVMPNVITSGSGAIFDLSSVLK